MSGLDKNVGRNYSTNLNSRKSNVWNNRSSVDNISDIKSSNNRANTSGRFREHIRSYNDNVFVNNNNSVKLNTFVNNNNSRNFSTSRASKIKSNEENESDWFKIQDRSEDYEIRAFGNSVKSGINFNKYDDIPVSITGKNVSFEVESEMDRINISSIFKENMNIAGYSKLTPIQKYAFGSLLNKHDMLGCAQTGSGKTAAFLIPILNHIYNEGFYLPKQQGSMRNATCVPKALILAPTRELASQIFEQVVKFCYRTKIRPGLFYGGISIKEQYQSLKGSGHILVGTPGRISDMFNKGYISFKKCTYMILDEADRMLDMGFEPQIKSILSQTDMPQTSERLNCMFSATFPDGVKHLVREYMNDYVMVTIGQIGKATTDITQKVIKVQPFEKFEILQQYLNNDDKILIFTETRNSAEQVEISLYNKGYKAVGIHGLRNQQERDIAISLFKRNKANIMVATGVASRGLDIPDVNRVIIYECPNNIDEYIHRIGRTGRAGNLGEAIIFFTNQDYTISQQLIKILKDSEQEIPEFLNDKNFTIKSVNKGFKKNYKRSNELNTKYSTKSYEKDSSRGSIDSDRW